MNPTDGVSPPNDMVPNSMSVVVVQAGATRRALDARPERAREALVAIEPTGRQALPGPAPAACRPHC